MALISPTDDRDLIFENIVAGEEGITLLPEEFILRVNPPRDQGRRPTCAAFVGAGIAEHYHNTEYLSPEFIYYHRCSEKGMYAREVFKILKDKGTPPEDLYPYLLASKRARTDRPGATISNPSRSVNRAARRHRITGYAKVTSIEGIKRAIYEHGPVYVALPQYNSSAMFWRRRSLKDLKAPACGHAVLFTGWDSKGFRFKNSWSEDWGELGFGHFPYEDFHLTIEAWAAVRPRRIKPRRLGRFLKFVNFIK